MKAFTNTVITKEELVSELKRHQLADNFIRGQYFTEDGKGCAVGCSLESVSSLKGIELGDFDDHEKYEELFNLPESFALLTDKLFEGISLEKSKSFPVDVIEVINIGSDLNSIENKFKVIVLKKNLETLESLDDDFGVIKITNDIIIELSKDNPDSETLDAARSAAYSATYSATYSAESAARSAAYSAARSAARSAAYSAAGSAARSAAYSAAGSAGSAYSAAYSAARSAAYDYFADELIKLIKECK